MTTIQLRRGTSAEWVAANPILAPGEIGVELDTNKFKIGDGVTYWSVAEYYVPAPDVIAAIQADMTAHLAAVNPHPQYGSASGLPDHIAAADPHPQYASDADLAAHVAAADPHPVYATDADLATHISAPDAHPQYATDADLTAHVAAADPHPQYATDTDLLTHRTDPNAHPQYALDSEFDAYVEAADVIYEKKSSLLTEALWWVDAAATENDRLVDLSGNDRDAIFGAGAAAPVVLPWDGEDYLWTPSSATTGTYNYAQFVSGLSGAVEVEARLKLVGALCVLAYGQGTSLAGVIRISATVSDITLSYFTGVGTNQVVLAWSSTLLGDDAYHDVRAIFSSDGVSATVFIDGTDLGEKVWPTPRPTTVAPSSYNWGYGSALLRASMKIDGATTHILDPRNVSADYSTIANTGSAGGNWTIGRAATGYKTAVVDRPLLLFGAATGQYASATFPQTRYGTRIMALRFFSPANGQRVSHAAPAGAGGLNWYFSGATNLVNIAYATDGSSTTRNDITVADGQNVIAVALSSSVYRAWRNGVLDPADGPVGTGVLVKDKLIIGNNDSFPAYFEFIADAFFDRALTDAEIAQVSQELAGTPHNKQSDPHPQYALESTIGNLLTENVASGTDTLGDITGFLGSQSTFSSDPTNPAQGTRSLLVTSTSSTPRAVVGSTDGTPSNGVIPVVPGQSYTFTVQVRSATVTKGMSAFIYWWTSAGNVAASIASVSTTFPVSSAWQKVTVTGVAPANAAFASARVNGSGWVAADTFNADSFGFWKGAGGQWAMPGTPITGLQSSMEQVTLWADLPSTGNWLGRKIHVTSGLGFCVALWNGTTWVVAPESVTPWYSMGEKLVTPADWSTPNVQMRRVGDKVEFLASMSAARDLGRTTTGTLFDFASNHAGFRPWGINFAAIATYQQVGVIYPMRGFANGYLLNYAGQVNIVTGAALHIPYQFWYTDQAWPTTAP